VNVSVASLETGALECVCNAYFMYVILKTDKEKASKAKVEAPGLAPQTVEEHLEYGLAEQRKAFRRQREARLQEISEETSPCASQNRQFFSRSQDVLFTELVLPSHANHMGNTFGGQIMAWMAKGATSAIWLHIRRCSHKSHGDKLSITNLPHLWLRPVSIDQIHFKNPSHVGDRVQVLAHVTRVFESTVEVMVQVTSAAVGAQRQPVEINTGYLTYTVYDGDEPLRKVIPDVTVQMVEQEAEHRRAMARQKFRLQRRENMSKPESSATGMSIDFDSKTSQADELSVLCISDILRVKESAELRWKTMPNSGKDIHVFVDAPQPGFDNPTRMKMVCNISCPPEACYKVLQDVSIRKRWDPTCKDCSDRSPIGEEAELVRMVLAAPSKTGTAEEHEMLLLRAWRADTSTHSFVVAARSVRCDSMSLSQGRQHGEILPSGYIIERGPGSGNSKVTFVGQFNSKTFEFARPLIVTVTENFRQYMETLNDSRGS